MSCTQPVKQKVYQTIGVESGKAFACDDNVGVTFDECITLHKNLTVFGEISDKTC